MHYIYRVPAVLATERISTKNFLKSLGLSTSRFKSVKHSGTFCVNGASAVAAQTMLKPGDVVSWDLPTPNHSFIAEDLPLDVLFEDEYFLIVNKPPAMLVHPVRQEQTGTVANAVLGYYRRTNGEGGFHPVHRIDRNTSGALLMAKTAEGQHLLSTCATKKKVLREYFAVARQLPAVSGNDSFCVNGVSGTECGFVVNAPIARIEGVRHGVDFVCGKQACTHGEVLRKTVDGYRLLRLNLDTGRTHQIRVHMAYIGMPLAGDELYGGDMSMAFRQMLHSAKIMFTHPFYGENICVTAPWPQDFADVLHKTGLKK